MCETPDQTEDPPRVPPPDPLPGERLPRPPGEPAERDEEPAPDREDAARGSGDGA
jgi:hypothetical protein